MCVGVGGGGQGGGGAHLLSKRVGVCCQEPGTSLYKSKTKIYPIVEKQYMLICSVS